jgi:general secretion pathway protein H
VSPVRVGGVHGRTRGFTLLEILVVLVIITVMTTLAVLSIGVLGVDRGLETEGERYTDVIAAATEAAQLEGRDYGVWFGPAGYQIMVHDEQQQLWNETEDDRLYAAHELPRGVTERLEIEGRLVPPGSTDPEKPRVPQVMLFASGDTSPYHLAFSRDGTESVWSVDGQPDGTMVVKLPEKPQQ